MIRQVVTRAPYLLATIIALLAWRTNMETPTDADRHVLLEDGWCHYSFDGPPGGHPLLLIHGGTVAAWEFDRLAPWLHNAGYRTLRPDLFGHGYSDRPHTVYGLDLFVRQMINLLDALDIHERVPVLGHSLGAAVAARLGACHPQRFSGAVLGAPLVDYMETQPVTRLLRWPLLGELMVPMIIVPLLFRRRARNYHNIDGGYLVGKFKNQLNIPGFGRALLAMFRDGALANQLDTYRAFATSRLPALVMYGDRDTIVLAKQIHAVLQQLHQASFQQIVGAGHAFLLTQPEQLATIIANWIADHCIGNEAP